MPAIVGITAHFVTALYTTKTNIIHLGGFYTNAVSCNLEVKSVFQMNKKSCTYYTPSLILYPSFPDSGFVFMDYRYS